MNLKQIVEKIDGPEYVAEAGTKYIYMCRNDGQFHRGDCVGIAGFATFIGRYTRDELEIQHPEFFFEINE
jgi:hypothetical protein